MRAEPRVVVMNEPACLGEKRMNPITRERWEGIMAPFPPLVRGRAANLAAHDWTVCAVDGAILITNAYGGGHVWFRDGSSAPFPDELNYVMFPPAPDQEVARRSSWRRYAYRCGGIYVERHPSEDGLWSLVHAGVFAHPGSPA